MKSPALIRLLSLIVLFTACDDHEETYPVEPHIEFLSAAFDETPFIPNTDILSITFSITDGDQDFGLGGDTQHWEFPFQPYYYFLKHDGRQVPSDKLDRNEIALEELIQYEDRNTPPYDTLPELNICNYVYHRPVELEPGFWLYGDRNENMDNIFIDYYYQVADGSFVKSDAFSGICTSQYGRIMPISELPLHKDMQSGPATIKMNSRKKGQIKYDITSSVFKLFESKKIKLHIYVQDRALNKSNVMETPEFFLKDI